MLGWHLLFEIYNNWSELKSFNLLLHSDQARRFQDSDDYTESQKREAARGVDSISPTSAPSQDHVRAHGSCTAYIHYDSPSPNVHEFARYEFEAGGKNVACGKIFACFCSQGERKVVNQQPLTHQQVFVKTSGVGGSTTFVSRLFQILEQQGKVSSC